VDKQPRNPIGSFDPLLWPWAAMWSALDTCFWWLDRGSGNLRAGRGAELPWTTPNALALELLSLRLRDFSRTRMGIPALVCAPYAVHGALIADFAPGHSIVEAFQSQGLDRVYVTDWRCASPDMRLLSIDSYLTDLNVVVDDIGPPVDLIGLCQGGWMSLIYAARFPNKVRRLVLVGAPVDIAVDSGLSRIVANTSEATFEGFVNGEGGIVRGAHLLPFWSSPPDPEVELQRTLSPEIFGEKELLERFASWHANTLDLPGTYYLQVVDEIFRQNRIATGSFMGLGRQLDLRQVTAPVFLLAGAEDEIVPAEQALATAALLGTPLAMIQTATAPCTHLGLFIGGKTLAVFWRRIAVWLNGGDRELHSLKVASA
jgi:poly(3-hydroxyalkanoate) synthetase